MKPILIFLLFFFTMKLYAEDLLFSTPCSSDNDQASLSFVGDILIHKALYQIVVKDTKHFSQIWNKTDGLIQKADFSVGNLEGPSALGIDSIGRDQGDIGFVYDGEVYSGTNFIFNYHPRILLDLKNSGYDLLTLANNHALDRYSIGIDKTIIAAKNAGLQTVGTRPSNTGDSFYKVSLINNIRVAFISCTETINGRADNDDQVLTCYQNSSRILGIINNLSQRFDIDAVIVLPHWGTEYSNRPGSDQKAYARKYIEAGALAVIGSHPHVLQPWEKYVSKGGRESLIIYSLGNFVAGQAGLARKTGLVAYLGLSKALNQKARIFGVGYTPTYRIDSSLYPVGSNGSKDVLAHVTALFGSKARIEPNGQIKSTMCKKQNHLSKKDHFYVENNDD